MSKSPLGVLVLTSTPPEEIGPTAALVEELGFGEVWVAEDYFFYGGFSAAAAALTATSSISVGLGVIAAVARHPAVTAMEIASLARTHPGRFTAGIGHGVQVWTDQMGLTSTWPLATMTECVESVRALLSGDTVDEQGRSFTFKAVSLTHPPAEEVPLLVGVVGPRSLELAGRIADGTVVSVLAGPTYLEQARAHIRRGMEAAGRTGTHRFPVFVLSSVAEDRAAARAAVRPALAFYLTAMGMHNPLSGALGWNDRLAELSASGLDHLAAEMPEEWLDEMVAAGDPDDIVRHVRRLLGAGATSVVLSPVNPATAADELRLIAERVLPQLG